MYGLKKRSCSSLMHVNTLKKGLKMMNAFQKNVFQSFSPYICLFFPCNILCLCLSLPLQVALMVAAEFWEQGDLERTVLDQQPIVRISHILCFVFSSFSLDFFFFFGLFSLHCFSIRHSLLCLLSAHDGQKLCRTATQDAVWFHRLCVRLCIQGNKELSCTAQLRLLPEEKKAQLLQTMKEEGDGLRKKRQTWILQKK